MYVITPKKNLIAKLNNPLPPKLEKEMQGKFVWVNPTNFKDSIELYKDQYMRIGVMREVCEAIRDHGLECEIHYPELSAPDFVCGSFIKHKALQEDLVLTGIRERFGFLTAPPGVGKCLGKDTPVLMYSGEIKGVQDIRVGDQVMGPDSKPRKVMSLARGKEEMFEIKTIKGETFTCNRSHILSVVWSKKGTVSRPQGSPTNFTVEQFLRLPRSIQNGYKLYRVAVNFPDQQAPLPIPPYIVGIWLGDGTKRCSAITTADQEVVLAWEQYAHSLGYILRLDKHSRCGKANTYHISPPDNTINKYAGTKFSKFIRNHFRHTGKYIPSEYLVADREQRLELLAGILDSDGYKTGANGYEIITKWERLGNDIAFLARSLGMYVTLAPCQKTCTNTGAIGTYWRLHISGHTNMVPLRVAHKISAPRKQVKNVLYTGFTLKSIGEGDYYGFTLAESDGLFMLGNFIVTHNTVCLTDIICKLGKKAVVITEAEEPFYGAIETIQDFSDIDVGRVGCGFHEPKDVTVCMLQTATRRIKEIDAYPEIKALFNDAKVWITDEAHNCLSNSYGAIYDLAKNVEYFLGMSATPFTSSDKESILYARIGPVLHEITYGEAVTNDLLVPFTCYIQQAPKVDYGYNKLDEKGDPIKYPSYIRNRQYSAVRKNYIVKNRARCEQYLHFTKTFIENGYSVAIIVAETEHGALFKEMYPDIVEVYGTTPKKRRKEIWEQLKKKEIMGVVTTLMDEATNIPSLDAVAIAAGGKSKVKLIQRLRNLRTFEGYTVNGLEKKEMGFVFITEDRADFVRSHSKLNIKHLKELARQHPACEVINI